MTLRGRWMRLTVAILGLLLAVSCAKKGGDAEKAPADSTAADTTLSYISDEVSFGVFFDEQGTKRTAEVKGNETKVYIIVNFPTTMEIRAVEWRLVLPEGVTVESDKFYENRAALLGTFEHGISETWSGPCVTGPSLLLHVLTLNVPAGLKNGEIAIMASHENNFLGVATCDEGMPMIRASAYKAVINPTE